MNNNPIGVVLCRIAAVWLVVTGLGGVGFAISTVLSSVGESYGLVTYSAVIAIAPLVAAFILWHYAENIASTRFGSSGVMPGDAVDTSDLLSIGIHLLGIWTLVFGVINAVQTETVAVMQAGLFSGNERVSGSLSPHTIGARVANGLQILLGTALILIGKKRLR